ncbi:hypothetical protein FHG87_004628 [Trinorchestia longiramus]|nr:hypothetical protein FHG87_004628 [Trinorchestia longiramus]
MLVSSAAKPPHQTQDICLGLSNFSSIVAPRTQYPPQPRPDSALALCDNDFCDVNENANDTENIPLIDPTSRAFSNDSYTVDAVSSFLQNTSCDDSDVSSIDPCLFLHPTYTGTAEDVRFLQIYETLLVTVGNPRPGSYRSVLQVFQIDEVSNHLL